MNGDLIRPLEERLRDAARYSSLYREAANRIAAIDAAIDAYLATVDELHKRSNEYDACMWDVEGWPCVERKALNALKEARRG